MLAVDDSWDKASLMHFLDHRDRNTGNESLVAFDSLRIYIFLSIHFEIISRFYSCFFSQTSSPPPVQYRLGSASG